jgi:hypothetical protein
MYIGSRGDDEVDGLRWTRQLSRSAGKKYRRDAGEEKFSHVFGYPFLAKRDLQS